MQLQPWNLVFLAGFAVYAGTRHVFERRARGGEKAVRRADGRELTLLALMGVGAILLPLLYVLTTWLAFADYRLPAPAPWCGTLVMATALWLFWRSHADLGPNWSVSLELRKGHELVENGVYRSIRHPMYAAIWLFSLAQGLLLENWLAGPSALAAFALMYFVRTPREEAMMVEFFGQPYRDYMRRTGRLFPRLRVR